MKIRRLLFTVVLTMGLTLALLWALGGNSPYVRAATFQVTNTAASGPGSLPQAILEANSTPGHDTITFVSGLSGIIIPTDSLTITDDVTLIGPGAAQLAVSGNNAYRVFYIGSGVAVTITELTVRDGRATNGQVANSSEGGGIWSAGTLYLDRVHLVNNTAMPGFGKGGGLYVYSGGSVTISGTQMFDNEASWEGGGAYIYGSTGSVTVNGGQVFNNRAGYGGGICAYGNFMLAGTQIFSNAATYGGGLNILYGGKLVGTQVFSNVSQYGGGVHVESGSDISTLFDETQIVSNTASEYGGGVYIAFEDATLNMNGGEISHNVAGIHGGGMYIFEGAAILTGTQVVSNTARTDTEHGGGGVYVDQPNATLSVDLGEINGNTALYGGGVYIYQGSVTLRRTKVLRNTVPDNDGGGVYVDQATALLNVSGSEISDNTAGYAGGGMYIHDGSAWLSGVRVVRNVAAQNGGGINIYWGSATLSWVSVLNNTASSRGGGVHLENSRATMSASGGEISDNETDYGGGGVWSSGSVTLNEIQVLRNTTGPEGGGGVWSSGNLTLSKAYIAQNTASTGSAIYQHSGTITPTTALTIAGNIYQANGLFAGSDHDLRIEGGLTLAGGHFYAPYEPYGFVLTGAYGHTGGTYHQTKSVNGSSPVGFPKEGGLIINANGQNLGSTQVADTANAVCAGVTAGDAVRHCTLITPTHSGGDATLTFYYRSSEIPTGQSCASMEAYRWTGAWDTMLTRDASYGDDGRMCGSDPRSIRVIGVNAFSPFALHQPMPANILVAPTALNFGEQAVAAGPTLAQRVTITNTGDFDLHISAITPSGDAGEFALTDSGAITLTPGSTRTIDVAFNPTSTGDKGAVLTIASDDSDTPSIPVILSGRGIDCEIVVAPDSLAFGEQDVTAGPTVSQTVVITNTGSAALHIGDITLTGNHPAAFVIASGGGAITLTTGSTHTVYVAFDPASADAKSANLTIQSDDGDEATINVALSGTGTGSGYKIFLPLTLRN